MFMKNIVLAAAVLSGCFSSEHVAVQADSAPSDPNVSYLCVGMEESRRFGSCPGCRVDAERMSSMFRSKFGYSGRTLISGEATKEAVVSLLSEGVDATPEGGLFLFCYSGHGGQEYLGGKEPDGADRQDEYLCLYDTHMLDDEIWGIVSRCRGRVFLYFDACHSATMWRSVSGDPVSVSGEARALAETPPVRSGGFTFRMERFSSASPLSAGARAFSPRILCWSGCKEDEYSYGGDGGGVMTTAMVNGWKKGISYGALWSALYKTVNKKRPSQHPIQSRVGSGFDEMAEAFR